MERKKKGVKVMFKKYDFVAIDCEKASNDPTSLCSIGIACFKNGKIKVAKEYIIKPYPFNFYIGSIIDNCYHSVPIQIYESAPTLDKVWPKINKFLRKNILVGHGINGDLQAIQTALEHYGIKYTPPSQEECICTNIASIYTYPEYESHKLKSLCEKLEIPVNPHHALSDAKASGYLLLDMMNVTDCKTAKDFINICIEYNQIITTKYTDRNIEKYEEKIKELFNYTDKEFEVIYKAREYLIKNIFSFFEKKTGKKITDIKIVNCISPIIEIYKNPEYKKYIDELSKLSPFTKDDFLYLKTGKNEYTLFCGLMTDRCDFILNLFLFLSRITIGTLKKDNMGIAYKRIKKYEQAILLWCHYLFDVENIDDIDIYKYVKYFYFTQYEYFRSLEFENQYNTMLKNTDISRNIYDSTLKMITKLIGIYLGIKECFPEFIEDIALPDYFNGTFNLFNTLIEFFEVEEEDSISDFIYIINKWFEENVRKVNYSHLRNGIA